MKTSIVILSLISAAISFSSQAKSVSACATTLDAAEQQISAQAKANGAESYTITSARVDNFVYMTANIE